MSLLVGIGVYLAAELATGLTSRIFFSNKLPKSVLYKLANRGQIMEVNDRMKMDNNFGNYIDEYKHNHIFKTTLLRLGSLIPGLNIFLARVRAKSCLKEKLASQEFSGSIRQMTPEEQQRFSIDRRSINPPTKGFIYSRNLTPPYIINEQQKNNLRFTKEEIERHFSPFGRTYYAMVNGKPTVIMGLSDRKFNELGNNPAKPSNIKLTVKRRRSFRPRVDAVLNVVPIPDSERDNKDYTVMYLGGNKPNILTEGYRNTYNARVAQRQAQQQARQNQQQQNQQNQQQQNQQQQNQQQQNQQPQNQQNQQQQAQQNQQNQQPQNQQQQNQQPQNVPPFIIGNGIYGGVPQTTVQQAQQQAQPVVQQPVQTVVQTVGQPQPQVVYVQQPAPQPQVVYAQQPAPQPQVVYVQQPQQQPVYQVIGQPQSSLYPIPYNGMVPGVTGFGVNPVGMGQLAASGAGYALVPVESLTLSPSQTQTQGRTVS